MANYREMIARCADELNKLHQKVRETAEHRGKSSHQLEQWERAAKAFHEYYSPVDDIIEHCLNSGLLNDPKLREFVFDYINIDPYFFRSGYIMESLLQRVKKLTLTNLEKTSIQNLVLKRIETRALRNFRHICRLIRLVDDSSFHSEVSSRAKPNDAQVKRRAEFALAYFPIDGRLRGDGFIIK